MVRPGTLLVMWAALAITWPARAQDPAPPRKVRGPPRLEYSAPLECPEEATFKHEVALVTGEPTGKDPFDANAPDVVRVSFTKIRGGYRATVQYTPAKGDPWPAEDKTGALCLLMLRSVATTASLRIPDPPPKDPPAPEAAKPAPVAPTPAPPDPAASKRPEAFVPPPLPQLDFNPPPPPPPPPPPQPPMDIAIVLSTTVLATAGFTADAGPALQLGADIRGDWLSLGLELRGVLPGRVYARERAYPEVTYTSERSFDVSQLTALLVPCVRFAT